MLNLQQVKNTTKTWMIALARVLKLDRPIGREQKNGERRMIRFIGLLGREQENGERQMIRFIDLRASNIEGYAFAWIIEETDCFLVINGSQAWDGWIDFAQDCRSANREEILATLRPLCPEWLEQEIRSHDIKLITNNGQVDTMIIDDPLRRNPATDCDLRGVIEWWEGSGVYKKRRQENNEGSVDWTGA